MRVERESGPYDGRHASASVLALPPASTVCDDGALFIVSKRFEAESPSTAPVNRFARVVVAVAGRLTSCRGISARVVCDARDVRDAPAVCGLRRGTVPRGSLCVREWSSAENSKSTDFMDGPGAVNPPLTSPLATNAEAAGEDGAGRAV